MEPKKSQLTYEIVYNKTLNFALFNNGIPLIAGLKLLYTGETPLKNLEITISCWPEFAKTYTRHIEQIDAYGLLFLDDIDIAMQPEYLYSLQERIEGKLDITITADACVPLQEGSESQAGRVTVAQGSSALSILAYEEWNGSSAPPEMLAAFITPNHNLVQQILRASTSYLEQWTSDTSITGYQQGGLTRVKQQMAAIYQAISDLNFRYTGIPASFESTGQKVRLPDAIETQGLINCLDASLLYAAALESAGLHPIVLITHGHALAGCWLVEEFFPEVAYDDMGLIEKRVQPGISEICVVETTCMTSNHPISFDTAVERGTNLCKDPDTRLYYFVDIKRARNSKIRPLPSRRNFTSYTDFSEHHPATLHPEANSAVEAPRDFALADPSLPVNTPQKTRLHMWQKQLLDLSLRNSFISFRSTLSTLALQPPCITTLLEDLLAGEVFSLHPTPEDLQNTPRDLEKLKEQEHGSVLSSIVFQEYQQKRLRTKYDKTMFKKRVTNVHRRARTSLEENGASSLFLVLGMLQWTEHADSLAPVRSAPLVMLPIAITRKSYGKGYTIQKTEDEVVCNETLIEYLKTTFQIDLSCLATLPQKTVGEESIVDLEHLFTMVRRVILNQERWNVEESATIALLSFRKFVMYHDLKNRTQELAKNKIVEALLQNDSSQIEHDHTNVSSLDTIPPNMLLAPLSADASQLAAMYAAEQGSSFVLHGPPGTGKSQTITNIIANALANSKRVLFVAEKMAALSVVKKRLHDIGLGDFCLELHSNKTSKRDLLDMLNKTLNKGVYHGAEDFKKQSAKVEELRSELNGYVEALHTVYPVGFSYYHGLNEFERLQEISAQPYFVNGAAATVLAHEFENIKEFLKKLYAAATRAGHPYTLPTGLIKMPELSFSDKQDIAQRARESLGALQELKAAQNTLDNLLGASVPLCELSLIDIELVAEFFQIHLPQEQVGSQLVSHYNKEKLNTCIEVLKTYQQTQTTVYQRYQETVHTLDIGALIGLYNVACAKNFLVRGFAKRKVVQHLLPHLKIGVNIKQKQLQSELELIQQYVEAKKAFEAITEEARGYFASSWHAATNPELLEATLITAKHAHKVIAEVQHSHLQETLDTQGHTLLVHQSTLKDATAQLYKELADKNLQLLAKLQVVSYRTQPVEKLIALYRHLTTHIDELDTLVDYNALALEADNYGVARAIVTDYESGLLQDPLDKVFEKSFYTDWLEAVRGANQFLQGFFADRHQETIEELRSLDATYNELTKEEIFSRLLEELPRVSTNTKLKSSENIMLQRAILSKGRSYTIRKLFSAVPNMITKLAPCMLMV